MGFAARPSNTAFLLQLRQSKKAVLKPCPLLKPSLVLRAYQAIGCIHLISLSRMVLGDSVGLGKCVSLDTLIPTSMGVKEISHFLPANPVPGEYYPIDSSVKLLSFEGVSTPNFIYYAGEQQGLTIQTETGRVLSGLPHHPILAPTESGHVYKRLDAFSEGDSVCISKNENFPTPDEKFVREICVDKVSKVTVCHGCFADFCVPEHHNFTGNGFINHNTCQMITAYAYLLVKDPTLKLLVVTTKSAMQQWADEFENFSVGITTHVLDNTYGKVKGKEEYGHVKDLEARGIPFKKLRGFEARKAQYDTVTAHVLVCNYNAVQEDYVFLVQNRAPTYAVAFDECQAYKNHKSKTHFGANEIAQAAKRVYGLSATLIKNKLEEAYNIYNVVVPGLFGGKNKFLSEYTIRKKMEIFRKGKKQRFQKIVGYKNLARFKETIEPFFLIRRTREVADELPRLISKKLVLELTPEQDILYKQALSGELYKRLIKDKFFKFQKYTDSKQDSDLTEKELETLDKLRERYDESLTVDGMQKNKIAGLSYCQLASNGPGWLGEPGQSSKEVEFERLFEQELMDEKVIVFTRFKSGIPRLIKILDNLEEPAKHVEITGDKSPDERTAAKKVFQDMESGVNVIFITSAGSAAINLQAAKVILFYDTPWSYGDLYQTIGRAQRIGSVYDHICLMHMVNKDTIDEHVLKILDSKKSLINTVMGDIAEGAIEFKDDGLMFKDDEGSLDALYSSVFG